jgi:hypothetical protein
MTKQREKYRAIADLYTYLEAHPFDDLCNASHCTIIDDGDGIEIRDSLYCELVASSSASKLLDAVTAHGIEVLVCDAEGYRYEIDFSNE